MKQKFITFFIAKSDIQSDLINYGLECLYILIEKTLIILIISALIGIFFEVLLAMLFLGLIRSHSFGFHFKNSKICLIISAFLFVLLGLSPTIEINTTLKLLSSPVLIALIVKKTPQDKKGRRIENGEKYKLITLLICLIIYLISVMPIYVSNIAFLSIVTQAIILKGGENFD